MSHNADPALPSSLRDARAVRSNAALSQALLALVERKPLEQVTIREIAAQAGVHYATFFRHYPTKEALLDHVAADEIERLIVLSMPVLDAADGQAAFGALCSYVNAQRKLWTALLTGGAAGAMRAELLRVSKLVAAERAPKKGWIPVELAVVCTVSLIVETLTWWLAQPAGQFSEAQVARILHRLVFSPAIMAGAEP